MMRSVADARRFFESASGWRCRLRISGCDSAMLPMARACGTLGSSHVPCRIARRLERFLVLMTVRRTRFIATALLLLFFQVLTAAGADTAKHRRGQSRRGQAATCAPAD